HSSGAPPASPSKKMPLTLRSIINIVIAASSTTDAKPSSQVATVLAQANGGRRRQARPGARRLRSVAIMLIAKQTKPRQISPADPSHASTPLLGRKATLDSGGSGLTPASGGVNTGVA